MRFCTRCTAIDVGSLIGMLIARYYNPKFNLVLLTLGLLPMVGDGARNWSRGINQPTYCGSLLVRTDSGPKEIQ